jgi:hypothetical protein
MHESGKPASFKQTTGTLDQPNHLHPSIPLGGRANFRMPVDASSSCNSSATVPRIGAPCTTLKDRWFLPPFQTQPALIRRSVCGAARSRYHEHTSPCCAASFHTRTSSSDNTTIANLTIVTCGTPIPPTSKGWPKIAKIGHPMCYSGPMK